MFRNELAVQDFKKAIKNFKNQKGYTIDGVYGDHVKYRGGLGLPEKRVHVGHMLNLPPAPFLNPNEALVSLHSVNSGQDKPVITIYAKLNPRGSLVGLQKGRNIDVEIWPERGVNFLINYVPVTGTTNLAQINEIKHRGNVLTGSEKRGAERTLSDAGYPIVFDWVLTCLSLTTGRSYPKSSTRYSLSENYTRRLPVLTTELLERSPILPLVG